MRRGAATFICCPRWLAIQRCNKSADRLGQPSPATHPHLFPTESSSEWVTPLVTSREYAQRRRRVMSHMPRNSLMILPFQDVPVRTHDILHPYRPDSSVFYLTGCCEKPSGDNIPMLVLAKAAPLAAASSEYTTFAFLFIKDSDKLVELWDGPSTGAANGNVFFNGGQTVASPEYLGCASASTSSAIRQIQSLVVSMAQRELAFVSKNPTRTPWSKDKTFSALPKLFFKPPSHITFRSSTVTIDIADQASDLASQLNARAASDIAETNTADVDADADGWEAMLEELKTFGGKGSKVDPLTTQHGQWPTSAVVRHIRKELLAALSSTPNKSASQPSSSEPTSSAVYPSPIYALCDCLQSIRLVATHPLGGCAYSYAFPASFQGVMDPMGRRGSNQFDDAAALSPNTMMRKLLAFPKTPILHCNADGNISLAGFDSLIAQPTELNKNESKEFGAEEGQPVSLPMINLGSIPSSSTLPPEGLVKSLAIVKDPTPILQSTRGIKTPAEVYIMMRAARVTERAFIKAMQQSLVSCSTETDIYRFLQTTVWEQAETFGDDGGDCRGQAGAVTPTLAYIPVVAAGPNALIIHYVQNDDSLGNPRRSNMRTKLLREHDPPKWVLVDAGAELEGYPCDCSRSWPIVPVDISAPMDDHGRMYNTLLHVQRQLLTIPQLHKEAVRLFLEALTATTTGNRSSYYADPSRYLCNLDPAKIDDRQVSQYFPHNVGHFIGLDLHEKIPMPPSPSLLRDVAAECLAITCEPADSFVMPISLVDTNTVHITHVTIPTPAAAPTSARIPSTPLQGGMAITVEPGLYIPRQTGSPFPQALAGVGVGMRIEDNVLVLPSRAAPYELASLRAHYIREAFLAWSATAKSGRAGVSHLFRDFYQDQTEAIHDTQDTNYEKFMKAFDLGYALLNPNESSQQPPVLPLAILNALYLHRIIVTTASIPKNYGDLIQLTHSSQ